MFQFQHSDAGEQSRIIDSLKNVLAGDLDDTTRFNTLILLSDEYAKTDIQSSLTEGLNAINFAKENNITIPKKLYINIADYFFKLGEYEEEINYLNKVIEIFKNNNDSMNIAYTNNDLAEAIFLAGDYTHAIEILKKNIQYCKKYDFQKCLLKSYYRIGTIFNRLSFKKVS